MRESTKDKIKGTTKEVTAKIKEKAGRATNDPVLVDEGQTEQLSGKVRKKIGDVKKVFEK